LKKEKPSKAPIILTTLADSIDGTKAQVDAPQPARSRRHTPTHAQTNNQKVDGAVSRALLINKISSYINVKQSKNPNYN
jgi:hypothetical protein